MKKKSLIDAWKMAEQDLSRKHPVEVNEQLMSQIHGGSNSSGHICTISGECNDSGESCGEILDILEDILR